MIYKNYISILVEYPKLVSGVLPLKIFFFCYEKFYSASRVQINAVAFYYEKFLKHAQMTYMH